MLKKLPFYSILSLIAILAFSSCSKDVDDIKEIIEPKKAPELSGKDFDISETVTAYYDALPEIIVNVEAPGKIEKLVLEVKGGKIDLVNVANSSSEAAKKIAESLISTSDKSTIKGETSLELNISEALKNNIISSESIAITIKVDDANGLGTEETLNIELKSQYTVEVSKVVLLGGSKSEKGSFYSVLSDSVYIANDAKNNQDKIDFLYGYYSSGNATILAPSKAADLGSSTALTSWTTKNATKISSVIASSYDELTGDDKLKQQFQISTLNLFALAESVQSHHVESLKEGSAFQFVLVDGTVGVAKVMKLTNGVTGEIELSVAYIKKEIGGNTTITNN